MKQFIKLHYLLLLVCSLSAAITGCKKTPDEPEPKPIVGISSIDPATAPVGSTIAVNGNNFDPASTTISIGGVVATIVSVSPTQIIVTVPEGVTSGPISVTSGGQTVQSPTSFTKYVAPPKPIAEKFGTIYTNPTWTSDSIYVLRGMVYIPEDHTLTIQPGTIIKGAGPERDPNPSPSEPKRAGALVIERRGQLFARGTAAKPIVFTSIKPAGQRKPGDWGGVALVGRSPVNRPASLYYPNGIRGTVAAYGEPFDNSGVLQYVRIEYAGAVQPGALQPTVQNPKLSGLTMIGVGAKTIIDHVQVSYCGSDAFSWFGGSVNAKNLFAYRTLDDDWTVDWGYVGNVQFGVSLRDPAVADQSGSNGFDVENYDPNEKTDAPPVVLFNQLPQTAPVFANISNFAFSDAPTATNTANGTGPYQSAIHLRRNSAIAIYNSLFYGYPEGLRIESAVSTTALTGGSIDLKGVVLANVTTPVAGAGVITNEQATGYFTDASRANQVIMSNDLVSLMLNSMTFNLTSPNFVPQTVSPLLTSVVTGGKLANSFFTSVAYKGAFGTDNWLSGWTTFNPQTADYDR
ncbi:IPT/TIG domain-containing protein [Spirosoma luteum]|uniref:IPT/TIG domain-containing protein n=1 Tax=Spirosoma luteum TaxID=431553 RepID=UPI00037B1EB5|nr:IPT/TIG domain-containing protein [Spirosoma luteum]